MNMLSVKLTVCIYLSIKTKFKLSERDRDRRGGAEDTIIVYVRRVTGFLSASLQVVGLSCHHYRIHWTLNDGTRDITCTVTKKRG